MAENPHITVLFFGPASNFAGVASTSLGVGPGTTVGDLRRTLAERFPRLGPAMRTIRIAINEQFVADSSTLNPGDEVALIPPVSGGGGSPIWVELFNGPLPADRVRAFVTGDRRLGGIVTFEGATRSEDDVNHGQLVRLDYEAYAPMAVRQMRTLAETACSRWSAGRIALVHRLGSVPPGEASVMIAVACPHRTEAFDACRWLIGALKKDVPIWKMDVFADGFVRWVEPGD